MLWFFEGIKVDIDVTTITIGALEISLFLILFYKMFLNGAQINNITTGQILRISEIKNVLERLKLDWVKIMNNSRDTDTSLRLLNNTFKDAVMYFTYME